MIGSLGLWIAAGTTAHAWMRLGYDDAEVVARADAIVVGRLDRASIAVVDHPPDRGLSHEHHATLQITEVIAGRIDEAQIEVVLHYGLTPVVGGDWEHAGGAVHLHPETPHDRIEILDTGNSAVSLAPLVPDASVDHVWLLRRRSGRYGDSPDPNAPYGIVDPEDLQDRSLLPYLRSYLAPDPETAVRDYLAAHPEIGARAQRYLDRLQIERILAQDDPRARCPRLVPYWLDGAFWNGRPLVEPATIAACAPHVGEALLAAFHDPDRASMRREIIAAWGKGTYAPAQPVLVALLNEQRAFWRREAPGVGWWNGRDGASGDRMQTRRARYSELAAAIKALGAIGDDDARLEVDATCERWAAVPDPVGMGEACARAKAAFDERN